MNAYIREITEEYLTGLSNKGTVKRGNKDFAALSEAPLIEEEDDALRVLFSGVEVKLCRPLTDAVCSCPSKTLCRHIVTAVLAVQAKEGTESQAVAGEFFLSVSYPELCEVPVERLMRAWGKGEGQDIGQLQKTFSDSGVELSKDTISVQAMGESVTLLEPFSASKCTCKKSSLCSHKALAALAVRYRFDREGILPLLSEYLQEEHRKQGKRTEEEEQKQEQLVKDVQRFLTDFMTIGLNRAGEGNADELMRLSIFSHNAGMPRLEKRLKQLELEWIHYSKGGGLSKKALFLDRICELYELSDAYLEGKERAREALTGSFRAEYENMGDCRLFGIASRVYEGKGGFVGNIYYFLDWEKDSIFTYQDIRPSLYEGRKKTAAAMRKEEAPWGLGIRKEEMEGKELFLKAAKISEDGKLSVSQDVRGEYMGALTLTKKMMGSYYYDDFSKIIEECPAVFEEDAEERTRLLFLKPFRIRKEPYDEIRQQFRVAFYDKEGCVIRLVVDYHKSREYFLRHLVRLFDRLEKGRKKEVVFFGPVFMGEQGLSFYPYEYFAYVPE